MSIPPPPPTGAVLEPIARPFPRLRALVWRIALPWYIVLGSRPTSCPMWIEPPPATVSRLRWWCWRLAHRITATF